MTSRYAEDRQTTSWLLVSLTRPPVRPWVGPSVSLLVTAGALTSSSSYSSVRTKRRRAISISRDRVRGHYRSVGISPIRRSSSSVDQVSSFRFPVYVIICLGFCQTAREVYDWFAVCFATKLFSVSPPSVPRIFLRKTYRTINAIPQSVCYRLHYL